MSNNLKNMRALLLMLLAMISLSVSAQTVTLTGNVKDQTGEPIIGASILEKGTNNGTITDFDGNFNLNVSGNATVVISYIGMQTQEIALNGRTVLDVTLADDTQALEEVVVIGYGTVSKKDLTGSVASVSAKQLENIPVASATEALQGKLAGVSIMTTEGSPDAEVRIRVRGGGSLSQDNSPLYIVDGFPVPSISDIAPSEIQSVDVLKDASSTAIYGSQGANGVIIITTKSGKEGSIQVNLGASFGVRKVTKQVDVLSPYEYALWQYEIDQAGTSYGVYDDLDIYKSVKGTNYQDEIFGRTGNQQQYNVSVSGGSKTTKFNISYARNEEKSIMRGSGFNKNNINAKINSEINKWLTLDFNARLANQDIDGLSGGADSNESSAANSLVARTIIYRPIDRLSDLDDDDDENRTSAQYTPIERLDATYKKQRKFRQNYNAGINWKPIKNITIRSEFGYAWNFNNTDQVWGVEASTNSKYGYSGLPQALLTKVTNENWRNANTITYDNKKILGGDHKLNLLLGHEVSSSQDNRTVMTSVGFASDTTIDEVLAAMGNGIALPTSTYIGIKDNLLSFFGRANYTIKEKYLFTVTMRADGSSKFAPGNQWGYFPSGAFAWRISDESWMYNTQDWLSNLKLRLSFGTAGNNRIPSGAMYDTFSLAGTGDKSIYFDNSTAITLKHGDILSNPELKWETTLTRNFGVDFGFLNNRLSGALDFYWNTTKDLLMKTTIPSGSGYSYQFRNYGQTSNKGIELSLDAIIVDNRNFNLNFNFNIAYNQGKIDKLAQASSWESSKWAGSEAAGLEDFLIEEGGRLGEVWGYRTDGFYTVDDFEGYNYSTSSWTLKEGVTQPDIVGYNNFGPGSLKLKADENGEIKKERLGNTIPKVTGGFGLNARYKSFDFSAFFNYSLGNKIINATKLGSSYYKGSSKNWNLNNEMNSSNRFTWIDPANGDYMMNRNYLNTAEGLARLAEVNQNATIWNPASVTSMPLIDWAVEDGSFLRINNISLGYTLPKLFVNKYHIQNVRIYVTGYNLYCFTKYSGADPEVDTRRDTPMTPGVDYAAYPKSRSFVGGINVTF